MSSRKAIQIFDKKGQDLAAPASGQVMTAGDHASFGIVNKEVRVAFHFQGPANSELAYMAMLLNREIASKR